MSGRHFFLLLRSGVLFCANVDQSGFGTTLAMQRAASQVFFESRMISELRTEEVHAVDVGRTCRQLCKSAQMWLLVSTMKLACMLCLPETEAFASYRGNGYKARMI